MNKDSFGGAVNSAKTSIAIEKLLGFSSLYYGIKESQRQSFIELHTSLLAEEIFKQTLERLKVVRCVRSVGSRKSYAAAKMSSVLFLCSACFAVSHEKGKIPQANFIGTLPNDFRIYLEGKMMADNFLPTQIFSYRCSFCSRELPDGSIHYKGIGACPSCHKLAYLLVDASNEYERNYFPKKEVRNEN